MRNLLGIGALAVLGLLIAGNSYPIAGHTLTSASGERSVASVLMYDEDGNFEWVDEADIIDTPPDIYYAAPYEYEPAIYEYDEDDEPPYYVDYEYGGPVYVGYDYEYEYGPVYYDVWDDSSYYYAPPQPPAQPRYVQTFSGIGAVAQTIVQGIAPQTRTSPRPTCSISANPSSIPYNGSTFIRWVSQNGEWADLTELGTVDRSGGWTFDGLTRSRTFTLNVSGQGGTGSCSTVVTVQIRR